MKNQTRRKFIAHSSKIIATIFGTATFGKSILLSHTSESENIQFCKSNFNSKNKGGYKILVAYESQFSSTGEVANFIGKELSHNGNLVEVKKIDDIDNLTTYSRVVIGSAIQYDNWMPSAREFLETNQKVLGELPVAFFFTCLELSKKTKEAEQKAKVYSDKLINLVPQVKPISIGQFAGVLDYSKMSFPINIIARGMFLILGVKEGDYRDWKAISFWTKSIGF